MFFASRIQSIQPNDKVLEIGPGGTPHERADVFLDLDPKFFKDEEEASYQRGTAPPLQTTKPIVYYDGKRFPFDDKSFDYVICSHVLEHVDDVPGFLSELFRITNRGYIEYPTILYDYIYDIPVHKNFLYFDEKSQTLSWLTKEDTTFADFKAVQAFFRESVIRGHDCLIQSLEQSMIQGFEWNRPFAIKKTRSIKKLVPGTETIQAPKSTSSAPTVVNTPQVVYKPLGEYSTKQLSQELKRRLEVKAKAAAGIKQAAHTPSLHETMSREELEFFLKIPALGRQGLYDDSSIETEERLLDKLWWWLTEEKHENNIGWANNWIEKHPAESVGTHNISNRELWLEAALKKIPAGKKILDAGAGELQYKRFCSHLEYVSQDFAQYTGTGDSTGLQTGTWDNSKLDIVSDITSIPVDDKSFDAIMCIEVFEHIPKPIEAIKEFSRIIRQGGTLIITAPFACMTHFAPYFFSNGYSKYFYDTILTEYGFDVKEITYSGNYFEYVGQEVRRIEGVAQTYAQKANEQTVIERLAQQIVLRRLEYLSKADQGSSELMAHGVHVTAVKR